MMCPLILIIGIGETIRSQYIYPLKMDKTMVIVLSLNAVINLALSALLIPLFAINGVILGTLAAEFTGVSIEMFLARKYVSIKWLLSECVPFATIGVIMFMCIKTVSKISGTGWLSLGIQIITGIIVYCFLTFFYLYSHKRNLLIDWGRGIKDKYRRK